MEFVEVCRLMTLMTPIKQYELVDAFNNYLLVIIADLGTNIREVSWIVTLLKFFLPNSNHTRPHFHPLLFVHFVFQEIYIFFLPTSHFTILRNNRLFFHIRRTTARSEELIKFASQIYFDTTPTTNHHDKMPDNNIASLIALPIELIYRILDHLTPHDILLSVSNVCERLNSITDFYDRYQVNFTSDFSLNFHQFRSRISYRYHACVVLHNLVTSVSV